MINFKMSAVVLTYNEEKHLDRCINSIYNLCEEIVVVDSFSNDLTPQIAKKYNCKFLQNPFKNYSDQFNWGLKHISSEMEWVLRIDADEYLTDDLILNLKKSIPSLDNKICGLTLNRLMYFMEIPLKYGGMYPISHLRIFRNGKGYCEKRWMDERIVLNEGITLHIDGDLIDNNLNNLNWWIQKHNNYAVREAIDILNDKYKFNDIDVIHQDLKNNGFFRRKIKLIYNKLPLFFRSFAFFIIRYFFQLGFLDGKKGFVWTVLQCFWYRFLIDAQIFEVYNKCGKDKSKIIKYFKDQYNYDVTKINK
tara:strand:- start:5172 stop:6089 length:918 start_codon:yes stop_codon:yes gene_type:complete